MPKIEIDCVDIGKISDGFHTFDELYAHRIVLFNCLLKLNKEISWKSKKHSDGGQLAGVFIAGMDLPEGQVTYHIPDRFWEKLQDIKTLERSPPWDGHCSNDVVKRLNEWCEKK